MSSEFRSVLVVVGCLAGMYYFLLPLLILFKQRFSADVEIGVFDPQKTPPPPSLARYFAETDAELVECGFRRLASLALPAPVPHVIAVLQMYVHDGTRDAALVSVIFGVPEGPAKALELRYVEILSRFRDSDLEILHTNNANQVGSFPEVPEALTFRLPQVTDLRRLFSYHQALLQRHAPRATKCLRVIEEFDGDAVRYLREAAFRESYERHVRTGYLHYFAAQDCWRATVIGAYLMTWKELWPFKSALRTRVRRDGRRLEESLQAETS